jgi:hypothetical protein
MKTTLILLIAGLIFLVTPMLAFADGRHDDGQNHSKRWVKSSQYNHSSQDNRSGYRGGNHYHQQRNYQVKNHLRKELRETRHDLQQIKQQVRHNRQRPYYVNPAVVIGIPHLVFQFGW